MQYSAKILHPRSAGCQRLTVIIIAVLQKKAKPFRALPSGLCFVATSLSPDHPVTEASRVLL
jgi:hypothetical protein